jgi:uncharacterized protein (DUF1684 family)
LFKLGTFGAAVLVLIGCARDGAERGAATPAEPATEESVAAESTPASPPSSAAGFDDAAWRADLDAWIEHRYASLREPDGWLSLAGLFWLEPGENTFGADPANALVFPAGKAPPRIGVFIVDGGKVRVRVEPGVPVTHDGQPVAELDLVTDVADDPTMLELGPLLFHAIDRNGRLGVRLKDRESPLIGQFAGIDRYDADPAWRIEARFEAYDPPKTILVPNIIGPALPETCPGRLVFELGGATRTLEPTGERGRGRLFIVFGDSTNGGETYGGGRFLYADWPAAGDDRVVLDFNRAYNPPCVFTPWATCPLPPPQNKLAMAIESGEKTYHGAGSH